MCVRAESCPIYVRDYGVQCLLRKRQAGATVHGLVNARGDVSTSSYDMLRRRGFGTELRKQCVEA